MFACLSTTAAISQPVRPELVEGQRASHNLAQMPVPGETEAGLLASLVKLPRLAAPIPGFGATDDPHHDMHFFPVGGGSPPRFIATL